MIKWSLVFFCALALARAQNGYSRDRPNNQFGYDNSAQDYQNEEDNGGGEIPGEAGRDYPVLSEVPETSFSCSNQQYPGYYADPEAQCQAFYICQRGGKTDSFLCPNGTVFNQEYLVCDWWYNFDCNNAESLYSVNEQVLKAMEEADARLSQQGQEGYESQVLSPDTAYGVPQRNGNGIGNGHGHNGNGNGHNGNENAHHGSSHGNGYNGNGNAHNGGSNGNGYNGNGNAHNGGSNGNGYNGIGNAHNGGSNGNGYNGNGNAHNEGSNGNGYRRNGNGNNNSHHGNGNDNGHHGNIKNNGNGKYHGNGLNGQNGISSQYGAPANFASNQVSISGPSGFNGGSINADLSHGNGNGFGHSNGNGHEGSNGNGYASRNGASHNSNGNKYSQNGHGNSNSHHGNGNNHHEYGNNGNGFRSNGNGFSNGNDLSAFRNSNGPTLSGQSYSAPQQNGFANGNGISSQYGVPNQRNDGQNNFNGSPFSGNALERTYLPPSKK